MKLFLLQLFTWWNRQTLGTRWFTWRHGTLVGEDEFGNRYYERQGRGRRWVVYAGEAEPTAIPPAWHGWIHHTVDHPPRPTYQAREWEMPHRPNLTGTPLAYRPAGSLASGETRPRVTDDYDAWTP